MIAPILDKFKEKKPVLKEPLVECIDAVAVTVRGSFNYIVSHWLMSLFLHDFMFAVFVADDSCNLLNDLNLI